MAPVFLTNRLRITQEPPAGRNHGDSTLPLDIDWSVGVQRRGGPIAHLSWTTNPKQQQDEQSAG